GDRMSANNVNSFIVKVPEGHCLSKVCGQGAMSQALLAPHRDAKNTKDAVLAASNGRVLAVVPVAVSQGKDRPLPAQVPAQLVPGGGFDTDDEQGCIRVVSRGKFPNTRTVLPTRGEVAGYTKLSLNLELLRDLAAAISPEGIIDLWIPPAKDGRVGSAVVVIGYGGGDSAVTGVGLIMPRCCADPKEEAKR